MLGKNSGSKNEDISDLDDFLREDLRVKNNLISDFNEKRLRTIFENNPQGVAIGNRYGFLIQVNKTWKEMFGYSDLDVESLHMKDIRTGEDYLKDKELFKTLINGDIGQYRIERAFVKKDGSVLWCDLTVRIIEDYCAGEKFVIGLYVDITERKKIEEALKHSEERNRQILEKSPVAIILTRTGRLIYANCSFINMFGYERNSGYLSGMMFADLICPDARQEYEHEFDLLERGVLDSSCHEWDGFKLNREQFQFLLNAVKIELSDGPAVMAFIKDITELKKTRLELQKSHDQLEKRVAERTEEIRRLNLRVIKSQESERQRVARDLHDGVGQTILAAKFALENFIRSSMKDVHLVGNCLTFIDRVSRELREIYTGLYPSMLTDLGLDSTIRWCMKNYLEASGMGVSYINTLTFKMNPEAEVNIYRILQELFNNIVKHSGADKVTLKIFNEGGYAVIELKDNGKGFSIDSLSTDSCGTGLINIRQRVEYLGGKLTLDSGICGTYIRIELAIKSVSN
jgi:PAS domain S-box-containing protein